MQKALITAAVAGGILLASAPAFAQTKLAPSAPASPTDQPALPEQHIGQLQSAPGGENAVPQDQQPANTSEEQK